MYSCCVIYDDWIYLGSALLVGQKKQFIYVTPQNCNEHFYFILLLLLVFLVYLFIYFFFYILQTKQINWYYTENTH